MLECGKPFCRRQASLSHREARELYLKAEPNYSMDSNLMRETAASLVAGVSTDFEKLVRIHDYVIGSVRYVRDDQWDPAATVLARGTGSCSEYNYVLSGLCRLAGLPTRCVGGTTNGLHPLPTTDTVFHRWTEVFLSDFGWFPVDCSRDANPIRGKRSHFGRVYVDVLVWCRQAGGEHDSLGWDYRAKAHVEGDDPGVKESHRVRWFDFQPEGDVRAAYAWFLHGTGEVSQPDLLECALVHWDQADQENRLRMLRALAAAGRNACIRRAVLLHEADGIRESCVRSLCQSSDLADTILQEGRDLRGFRNWFKSRESRLVPNGDGQFRLVPNGANDEVPSTNDSSSKIWSELVPTVIDRLKDSLGDIQKQTFAVMPVVDQTLAGVGPQRGEILSQLETVPCRTGWSLVDRRIGFRPLDG